MFLTLLFLHLVAVALLFSGMGIELAAILQLHRAATVSAIRAAMQNGPLVGMLMSSGLLLLLAMGIAMVYTGGTGWQPWTTIALIVTLALGINGPITNGKRGEAIAKLAEETPDGPVTQRLEAMRCDRFWNYSIFTSAAELFVALYIMSNKPSAAYCVAAVVAGAVVGSIPVLMFVKRPQQMEPFDSSGSFDTSG
ncbi:MAG TPA: hypothetical protein VGZ02_13690 [Candidatus Baltobacteraceae bacterium]|jgi:hypothetical protein|nr:hypothetical protein [Candidatus Baltobacteraceae bacterium]